MGLRYRRRVRRAHWSLRPRQAEWTAWVRRAGGGTSLLGSRIHRGTTRHTALPDPAKPARPGGAGVLFEKIWAQVKGAERSGRLTVEEALDCATRLPQALFCSMMECLAENGEDPDVVIAQVIRLHQHMLRRLQEVAAALRHRPLQGPH